MSTKPTPITTDPDYANLVALLSVLSEAYSRQLQLQADMNQQYLETVDEHKTEYAENQNAIGQAEAAIEIIVRRHPEWFTKKKTLSTPYGEVKSVSSKKLDAPSEDATLRLIKAAGRQAEFIRVVEELDKEALEKLTDAELAEFGLSRKSSESVTVKPVAINLGDAVKEAEATRKKAA